MVGALDESKMGCGDGVWAFSEPKKGRRVVVGAFGEPKKGSRVVVGGFGGPKKGCGDVVETFGEPKRAAELWLGCSPCHFGIKHGEATPFWRHLSLIFGPRVGYST